MNHVRTIFSKPFSNDKNKTGKNTACGECQSSCQSACKTSCTVANQKCESKNTK